MTRPWTHLVNSCPDAGREHWADIDGFKLWLRAAMEGCPIMRRSIVDTLDGAQIAALYLLLCHAFDHAEDPGDECAGRQAISGEGEPY
jgi:hypothetical protein